LFAAGNLLGPLAIGRFFDTIGRKQMIAATYLGSGAMFAVTAVLFDHHVLTATTQTIAWCVIFFFASAGASSAYLTVSEVFPLELRAQAIAVFFAIAQCFGALGPVLYGHVIGNGANTTNLLVGYLIGAGAMVLGGLVDILLGVAARASRWRTSPIRCPWSVGRSIPLPERPQEARARSGAPTRLTGLPTG
jgi:MFS family permease